MAQYAKELYHCVACGRYPIERVVQLPPPKDNPKCPCCNGELVFEKVYSCDSIGNITE